MENSDYKFRQAVRDLERKDIAFCAMDVIRDGKHFRYYISDSHDCWMVQEHFGRPDSMLAQFNSAPGSLATKLRNHLFSSQQPMKEQTIGPKGIRVAPTSHFSIRIEDWELVSVLETRGGEYELPIPGQIVQAPEGIQEVTGQPTQVSSATEPEGDLPGSEGAVEPPPATFASPVHDRTAGLIGIHRSISNEQDEILRQSARGILVLNGIPGSGKTSVGLMRIAWLLDSRREENEIDPSWNPQDPKTNQPWKVDPSKVVIVSRAEHLKNYIELGWTREFNYGSIAVESIVNLLPNLLKHWLEWHPQDQVVAQTTDTTGHSSRPKRGPLKFRPNNSGGNVDHEKFGKKLNIDHVDAFLNSLAAAATSDWTERQNLTRSDLDMAHKLAIGSLALPAIRTWLRETAQPAEVKSWVEESVVTHTARNGTLPWLDLDSLTSPSWIKSDDASPFAAKLQAHFETANPQITSNPISQALELRIRIQDWVRQNLVVPSTPRLDDLEQVRTRTKRLSEQLRDRWPELRPAFNRLKGLWSKDDAVDIDPDTEEDSVEEPQLDEKIPDPSRILSQYRSYWRRWAYSNLHPRELLGKFHAHAFGDHKVVAKFVENKPANSEDMFILLWILARLKGTRTQSIMTLPAAWDHIMIDEAQLYPPYQINALLQFTSGPLFSATICGDPYQRTFKDQVQWNASELSANGDAPVRFFELQAGYRWGSELLPFFKQLSHALHLPYAEAISQPDNVNLSRGKKPRIRLVDEDSWDSIARQIRGIFETKAPKACVGLVLPGGFNWTEDCPLLWALRDASISFQYAATGREINLDANNLLIASCDDMIGLELDHVAILHPEEILTRPGLQEDDAARHFWTVATRARLSLDLFVTEVFLDSYGDFARPWLVSKG
ncbi:MAG: hypothetical protein IPK50_13825 [Fibrobacterota bacterium]|nr:MAG: hypothetical protein IPK50_13825 [Fibrobacterota bacterium]